VTGGVRYYARWPGEADGVFYRLPAVVFRMQDAAGVGVAAEGRWLKPPTPKDKARTYGVRDQGVFVATPGALDTDGVTVCEGAFAALSVAACGFPAVALCGRYMPAWLAPRLALRTVYVSLDCYEEGAETRAAAIVGDLVALGCRTYRLAPPAGGDWNDHLGRVGLEAMRAELAAALAQPLG
jgi:hypothetical protein